MWYRQYVWLVHACNPTLRGLRQVNHQNEFQDSLLYRLRSSVSKHTAIVIYINITFIDRPWNGYKESPDQNMIVSFLPFFWWCFPQDRYIWDSQGGIPQSCIILVVEVWHKVRTLSSKVCLFAGIPPPEGWHENVRLHLSTNSGDECLFAKCNTGYTFPHETVLNVKRNMWAGDWFLRYIWKGTNCIRANFKASAEKFEAET